ncbi:MAG: isochorismatase [Calditrichia bacterium]
MRTKELPLPPDYKPEKAGEVWRLDYQKIAYTARGWSEKFNISPAARDEFKICLLAVDVQNTFCIPGFELFVGGRSGNGAVEDNRRLTNFIYRNLHRITRMIPTMDTHQAMQIFHSFFFVDDEGKHPEPYTIITPGDVRAGRWRVNPAVSDNFQYDTAYLQNHLRHYTETLSRGGKYDLTIWPYHSMLGGIGHAMAAIFEEAVFFHTIARQSQPEIHIKGNHPLTEHYSVFGPEVAAGPDGKKLTEKSEALFGKLMEYDTLIIAGQAKSHCVAWTVTDLLAHIENQDESLAQKVYLLEDCASAVVVPGVIDYTEEADATYKRFADAGMHIVRSIVSMSEWPGKVGNTFRG